MEYLRAGDRTLALEKTFKSGLSAANAVLHKATVNPLTTTTGAALLATEAANDHVAAVRTASFLGPMSPDIHHTQFETPLPTVAALSASQWIGEGNPIPIVRGSFSSITLPPTKLGTTMVFTFEVLRLSNAAEIIQPELIAASALAVDSYLVDPTNSGASNRPASVTYGVTPVASTNDPLADLKNLVRHFSGDLASSYILTDPQTATSLALYTDGNGAVMFQDCGPRGGSILQIPLLTSTASPHDSSGGQIVLLDASALAVADDGIRFDFSEQAAIAMSDSPSSPATMVSMYQTNSSALRMIHFVGWGMARSGSVAYIADAAY